MSDALTLLVDAADLSSPNSTLQNGSDLLLPAPKRGGNILIPYGVGEQRTDKFTDAKTISTGWLIAGGDADGQIVPGSEFAYLMKNLQDFFALLPDPTATNDMSCTLTRRLTLPTTGVVNDDADAEYLPGATQISFLEESNWHARVVVQFRLLTGAFG